MNKEINYVNKVEIIIKQVNLYQEETREGNRKQKFKVKVKNKMLILKTNYKMYLL